MPLFQKKAVIITVRRLIVAAAWMAVSFEAIHRRKAGDRGQGPCIRSSVRSIHHNRYDHLLHRLARHRFLGLQPVDRDENVLPDGAALGIALLEQFVGAIGRLDTGEFAVTLDH